MPKNNWIYAKDSTLATLTESEWADIEQDFNFEGQDIIVREFTWTLGDMIVFDWTFMGVNTKGKGLVSEEAISLDYAGHDDKAFVVEMKEVFSEDNMNDIYENHEQYK